MKNQLYLNISNENSKKAAATPSRIRSFLISTPQNKPCQPCQELHKYTNI